MTLPAIRISSTFRFSWAKKPFWAATAPNKNEPSTLEIEILTLSAATPVLPAKPSTMQRAANAKQRNFTTHSYFLSTNIRCREVFDEAHFDKFLVLGARRLHTLRGPCNNS